MARKMSKDDALTFIAAQPARTGKVATVRVDGRPHVAPVWVALDGDRLVFTTAERSLKGRTLTRDSRVAVCFDDDRPPFSFVLFEGEARISRDLDELFHWATVIGGRYMGDEVAEQFGRRNAVEGELLIHVVPTNIVGEAAVAD